VLPASNKGPSLSFGFPDVCLTPVGPVIVPIPYPNFGAHAMAATFSPIVSVAMIPALNMGSVLAMTTGDEPGVAHWTIKGPGTFDTGNPVVFVDMLPAICLTCLTDGNTANNEPGTVVMPGAPNVLYTWAARAGAVEEALAGDPVDGARLEEGIGELRVRVFSMALPGRVHLLIARWLEEGLRALVLDLRGCRGGLLRAFIAIASDFLPEGAELATLEDAEGDRIVYRSRSARPHAMPLVLVVDGGTASAAELFAGCLQAHGRATVVGERTHGKGIAQCLLRDAQGGAALATAARVFLPGGAAIHAVGLTPDVPAEAEEAPARGREVAQELAGIIIEMRDCPPKG
jgi:carboxyl-terminal processing protease